MSLWRDLAAEHVALPRDILPQEGRPRTMRMFQRNGIDDRKIHHGLAWTVTVPRILKTDYRVITQINHYKRVQAEDYAGLKER